MAGQARVASIDVDSSRFRESLIRALQEQKLRTEPALQRKAFDISNRAKEMCPVATGRMRAAIRPQPIQHDARGAYIEVGIRTKDLIDAPDLKGGSPPKKPSNYAIFVEFGTSKMRAQPFMRPALAEAYHMKFTA